MYSHIVFPHHQSLTVQLQYEVLMEFESDSAEHLPPPSPSSVKSSISDTIDGRDEDEGYETIPVSLDSYGRV